MTGRAVAQIGAYNGHVGTVAGLQTGQSDVLRGQLMEISRRAGAVCAYRELDPDVFGDVLSDGPYREVERLAAVGAVIRFDSEA